MIHNNSVDPILIKKIELQIWLLRNEIESIVDESLTTNDPEKIRQTIIQLKHEYNGQSSTEEQAVPDNVLSLDKSQKDDADITEDFPEEMLAANNEETEGEDEAASSEEELEAKESHEGEEDNGETPDAVDAQEAPESNEVNEEPTTEASAPENTIEDQDSTEAVSPTGTQVNNLSLNDLIPKSKVNGVAISQRRPALLPKQILSAMCFLSEVNMDAIYFFSNDNLVSGQNIVIDFRVPQRFLLQAEVVFCRPYNMRSRIISSSPHPFRCAARPLFKKEGERSLLREFLETVEPDVEAIAAQQRTVKIVKKKEEEEDIDDLDDLDL